MSDTTSEKNKPPLAGLKVLDASRVLSGPYAAMLLGDLGAEVIKLERPGVGDQTRAWGPPYQGGESAYYLSINRNKRSIACDLKTPEGAEIFRRLAAQSDVLLENFQPGDLDRLGLGYERLKEINGRLIFCSITGYGQTGSSKNRPAYDIALQAECGLMSITGTEEGEPVRFGIAVVDIITAHHAIEAILSALWARERSGRGQRIDAALFDCSVAFLTSTAQFYFATGEPPRGMGSRHPTIAPYQAFPTKDSFIVVAGGSQDIWRRFCRAIAQPQMADDARFADNSSRVRNRSELERVLTTLFRQRTTSEWLEQLQSHDVPCSPVNDLRAVFDSLQVQERGLVSRIPHPTAGDLATISPPVLLETTPAGIRRPPPFLGEHSREILQELGYGSPEIELLRQRGVIST